MQRSLQVLLIVLLSGLLLGCGEASKQVSPAMFSVGPNNYTEAQFTNYLERAAPEINQVVQSNNISPELIRQQIFDSLIQEEVFLNEARQSGAGIDADSTEFIQRVMLQNTGQENPTFKDLTEFAQANNFDSYEDLRTYINRVIALDNYAQTVNIEGVPQQVHVRHILISVQGTDSPAANEEARKTAENVVQQLRNGASFAELASQYSEDPGSAVQGGDLGWADPAGYVDGFKQAVQTLPLNQVSDPVETQFGWHIIEVLGRQTFQSWRDMQQSDAGQAYINQVINAYKQNGTLKIYISPETVPLPASITAKPSQ